jgi:hypothetical protein
MIRALIAALSLGLAFGPYETRASPDTPVARPVILLASDRPAYGTGMVVTFTMAIDNPASAPDRLEFPSSQVYDIVVLAGDTEVWRWSADRVFASVMTEVTFPPGVALVARESWDWRDKSGAPLPPGTYRVVGLLTTSPPQAGNVVEISLRAR